MQQYHDNRCRTARGPYGYVTQWGVRDQKQITKKR